MSYSSKPTEQLSHLQKALLLLEKLSYTLWENGVQKSSLEAPSRPAIVKFMTMNEIQGMVATDLEAYLHTRLQALEELLPDEEAPALVAQLPLLKRSLLMIEKLQRQIARREGEWKGAARSSASLPGIQPVGRERELPLSFTQQRLWFLDQLDPGKSVYNEYGALHIRGELNHSAFERSINEIVRRHESLRTTFVRASSSVAQSISPWKPIAFQIELLTSLPALVREAQAMRILEEELQAPFDLSCGPLFRVRLLQLAGDEYVFLLVFHHSIGDGWSLGVFYRELASLYHAFCQDLPSPLKELKVQYADFAVWQQRVYRGSVLDEEIQYWFNRLQGAPAVLDLPVDKPRPAVFSNRGSQVLFSLPIPVVTAMRQLCRHEGVTLFMLLLAAFEVLLYRYTGQEDLLVGTTVANRQDAELEALIGFFANTLVLRGNLSGNPTFKELLARVRGVVIETYEHQQAPFEQLVSRLQISRDLSRTPLFQVMLVLQNASWLDIELAGCQTRHVTIDRKRATFDMVLSVVEGANELQAILEYNTDLFERSTIERMVVSLQTILQSVVAKPDLQLDAIPVQTERELKQQLSVWNDTGRSIRHADACIHQLFEEVVLANPHKTAVVYRDAALTYEQLNQRANQLAHYLRATFELKPEVPVGICMERSLALVVAVLGVLKAGGAYIPLDPTYPRERLAYMLDNADASLVLTEERVMPVLSHISSAVVCLDAHQEIIAEQPVLNLVCGVESHNLVYVIYTSGSTGEPKGVQIEHVSLVNLVEEQIDSFSIDENSRVLQFVSFSSDVSAADMFMSLCAGATLYLVPTEMMIRSDALHRLLREQRITIGRIPPSILAMMPDDGLSALSTLISGGESWSPEITARWGKGRRFLNEYGPTEVTICTTMAECSAEAQELTIGRPLANTHVYILDTSLQPVPIGVPGELFIGGKGLARAYLKRGDLTASQFLPNPFSPLPGARMYKTGDRVRYLADGSIKFLGRVDHQVKIRGFRIEIGEIETALASHPQMKDCAVIAREVQTGNKQLIAFYVLQERGVLSTDVLRTFLKERLPAYMLPASFVALDKLPLSPNGKVDRRALSTLELARPEGTVKEQRELETPLEQTIAMIWQEVLQQERVGLQDNYFDLGGHSLNIVEVHHRLQAATQCELSLVDLFTYPTVQSLASFLSITRAAHDAASKQERVPSRSHPSEGARTDIAIIGMAGRFPQAETVEEFWHNLQAGIESVEFFSEEEMQAAGVDDITRQDPNFVPAGAILNDVEWFDAAFFQYSPREAEIIDPQQRLFLECAWEALEDAGYDAERYNGSIAVYGGQSLNTYLPQHLRGNPALAATVDDYQLVMSNSPDFLTTRVSYKLALRGPSVAVQAACSTSLVAVHVACESLRMGKCQMALAGGVSVRLPQKAGYIYKEGGIMSPDGHCRAFDEKAQGIVGGEGVGIIVLKRLEDALAEGDSIRAVIKGSAINNDGANKVGFTAPSVKGQTQVINEALETAGVEPESISYIEAHGTGTFLGDAIEIAALRQMYPMNDARCALGSVKTNIGHLDAAAGIAGLIKTVQALGHRVLPPSLHFNAPNPNLDLSNSHFYINAALTNWERDGSPRRAGVSSFGIGGTNAHVIVEEAPERPMLPASAQPWSILPLAARTDSALQRMRGRLASHLKEHPDVELANVAYTLQVGRKAFKHRDVLICQNVQEAIELLEAGKSSHLLQGSTEANTTPVVFLFPGQGAQHIGMGANLYRTKAVFRREIDRCAELLLPHLGVDIREVLYPQEGQHEAAARQLDQTWLTQPAIFMLEYALAQLWISWGVRPSSCLGHSIGEYVAACLSGVFSLEAGLELVALRGRLMQALSAGAMLALPLSEQDVRPFLEEEQLSVAAVNTSTQCVVSGSFEGIAALEQRLREQGVEAHRVRTSHAFHSKMMEPILATFVDRMRRIPLRQPTLPYISNVTGTWITEAQATDPEYWATHLRSEVRFADGVRELLRLPQTVLLEVGPGQTLSGFVRQQMQLDKSNTGLHSVVASLRRASVQTSDVAFLLTCLGRLWLAGVAIDWAGLHAGEERRRVSLPTYPFERKRYWIERLQTNRVALTSYTMEPQTQDAVTSLEANNTQTFYPRANLESVYVAPRHETEQKIVAVWQQFLGIEEIGVYDNFFDLGGSSLLATLIMSHLQSSLQCEIPLRDLFESLTIAELAERVERYKQAQRLPTRITVSRTEKLPLSFAQQRIWLDNQLKPGNPLYNIPIAARLKGMLRKEVLEKSLQMVVARHGILRTHFSSIDGQMVQIIAPHIPCTVSLIDLRSYPAKEREEEMLRRAHEQAVMPFNLAQEPLFRFSLFCLDDKEYVLLLVIHHMIADGWSLGIFFKELAIVYAANDGGVPADLPELPIQYADFASWQREWLRGEILEEHLAYWRKQLHGNLPILNLPTDRPRPPVQTYHGAHLSLELPYSLVENMRRLCQQEDVTLFMLVLAAFQVLLYRYTGLEDIIVGTPIAGRNRLETEDLIGNFIGALVLRTDLTGNPTFTALLQRVREVTLSAYAHQDMPFEQLIEMLQPQRDPSRSPIFQVLLRLPNVPIAPLEAGELTLSIMQVKTATASHDLILDMVETAHGFTAQVEYNTDLFEETTIERFLQRWKTLLLSMVGNPHQTIGEVVWLPISEQQHLLTEWNESDLPAYEPKFICEVFEEQVRRTPEAIAVSMGNQQISYFELNQRANQLAHYLRTSGVGPEEIVGVCLERSLNMVVALLGILKAGGAYVPLDPNYPDERLLYMLEDSHLRFILSHQCLSQSIPEAYQAHVIYLDSDWQHISRASIDNPLLISDVKNLAYVIYTSGSTGKPKGVLVTHYGLYNLFKEQQKGFSLHTSDHLLQFASINFDASVSEVVTALCVGAHLCLASREELMPGPELIETLRRRHISVVTLPPSVLALLPPATLPELGTLVAAGEACSMGIVKQWAPGRRFINAYGPTENTVCATLGLCSTEEQGMPAIGKPIAGVEVFILDRHLQLVPPGVSGEVYIGGVGLARGYLHRPDLTAERFIPHPFSRQKGTRLYKTGDLARYRPDGQIEFLGRSDYQIKIRGFRIELGEIEAVLSQYPAIRECVVVPREERGDKCLVAYFTVKHHHLTPTKSELRMYLHDVLPEYMVPSIFVHLDTIPLTLSEKIDRQALPDPHQLELSDESGPLDKPRNPLEELLASAFMEILGVQRVGVYENFFELGGHSLLATQLISRLIASLNIDIPVHTLFEAPTVADLALHVEQMIQSSQGLQIPPIKSMAHNGDVPLSFAQRRIWFMEQLQPEDTSLYVVSCALRINRPLHLGALKQSIQEIVRRHQILRATITTRDGQPVQVISPELTLPLPVVFLDGLQREHRHKEVVRLAQQEALQPFDLVRGPLVRTCLLSLGQDNFILLLTLHNLIADGWSREVWIQELVALYQHYEQGGAPLPELPVQYADYVLWQRQWMQGEMLEKQLAYWREQLDGIPASLNLPTDRPRPAIQTYRGNHIPLSFSPLFMQRAREFCQGEGVTLFMFLLTSFNVLLARYTGQEDIVIGTPVANRNRVEIENLIGFFANSLVLRTKIDGNLSVRELLTQVREVAMGAYAHQDLPFEKLVEVLKPERDLSRSPLFQVMFTLQNTSRQNEHVDWLWTEQLHIESESAKFDLNVFLVDEVQNIMGQLEYNTDLFDASTMKRLLQQWLVLLESMLENPEKPVYSLPILTDSEWQTLLGRRDAYLTEGQNMRCVHQLFEAQVRLTPQAIAVATEAAELTYQEVNERANRLAHHLHARGMRPGSVVGVCLENSSDLVVSILAVFKAGCVLVLLDASSIAWLPSTLPDSLQISLLLADKRESTGSSVSGEGFSWLYLAEEHDRIEQWTTDVLQTATDGRDDAYVAWSPSDCTIVSHQGVSQQIRWLQQSFCLTTSDTFLYHGTRHTAGTLWQLCWPLVVGARLLMISTQEGEKFSSGLNAADAVYCSTALLTRIAGDPLLLAALRNTRLLLYGEVRLNDATTSLLADVKGLSYLLGGWPITCYYCERPCAEKSAPDTHVSPRVFLLDEHQQLLPTGVPGEVCVAVGDLVRPAQGDARYTYVAGLDQTLYKTGYDGRILSMGQLEIHNLQIWPEDQQATLTIAATFTAEPIQEALTFWLQTLLLPWGITFAPYHQLFQQLLDPESVLVQNRHGSNLLLVRFEDWLRSEQNAPELFSFQRGDDKKIEKTVRDMLSALEVASKRAHVPSLFCICPPSEETARQEGVTAFFEHLEECIVAECQAMQAVTVITSRELLCMYPTASLNDPVSDELGHVPYTSDGFTALATMIARRLFTVFHPPYKVIVVDCDNTLWSGVCGEDGPFGVKIEAHHLILQEFLIAQQQAGKLICLCSKNNEEDVFAVFNHRPEMLLQKQHLAGWKINWQTKSANVYELTKQLQLDMSSVIFLDDSPLECAEVEAHCPQVLAFSLAEKFTTISEFLKHIWAFDQPRVTEEDRKRTAFYQASSARHQLEQAATSYQDFLATLKLHISVSRPEQSQLPRVAQLTQRTNQFTLTSNRYFEAELQHTLEAALHECLVVTVSDRFGDYGLVGVMFFSVREDALVVDTFLLSCRAMGRGVEYQMVRTLGKLACERKLATVVLPYRTSPKNKPARDFLEQVGAPYKLAMSDGSFTYSLPAENAAQVEYSVAVGPMDEMENVVAVKQNADQALDYERSKRIIKAVYSLTTVEMIAHAVAQGREKHVGEEGIYREPRTQIESGLVDIWQQVLQRDRVGIHSNFFALGGHSLLATQLLSRIATVFLVKLPLQSVFEAPTIAQLAELVQGAVIQKQRAALPAIVPVERSERMVLSFAQQRLWFLHQLMPESASYNIPLQMRLQGPLNVRVLRQSMQQILMRHEILRTMFGVDDGQPYQSSTRYQALSLPLIDLRLLAPECRELEMLRLVREDSQRIFDLTHAPMIRTTLCRLEDEHHVLFITVHHIVFDAWSGGVLSRELMALYAALHAGESSPLPALPIQYADFASWQQQWLQGERLDEQLSYWRQQLRGAANLELPTDRLVPMQRTSHGKLRSFAIPRHISDGLMALSRQEGATLFMTMLAAFQVLLHRYSEQEDIVVGTDIANRTWEETEGLIGFFVNLLALRTSLNSRTRFNDLLARVRETVLEAYAHQDVPFEKIVDALQLQRSSNQTPLVRALFVLQNTPMPTFSISGLTLSPIDVPLETTNFDLGVFLVEDEQGITARVNYSVDLFEEQTITTMIDRFIVLMESIIAQPDALIGTLEMYTPEERAVQSQEASRQHVSQSQKLKRARRIEINL